MTDSTRRIRRRLASWGVLALGLSLTPTNAFADTQKKAQLRPSVSARLLAKNPALNFTPVSDEDAAHSKVAIGFSALLFRLEDDEDIGIAKAEFVVHILEALRDGGYQAVGAESLLFGKDKSAEAELVLGGVVRELDCHGRWQTGNCRIGIEWQLMDPSTENVLYKVMTRHRIMNLTVKDLESLGKRLVLGALDSLMSRAKFKATLSKHAEGASESRKQEASRAPATLARCATEAKAMPAAAEQALDATVVIETKTGIGSGFVVNSDGYVLTAAHVVAGEKLKVHTRDKKTYSATVLRKSKKFDTALIRLESDDHNSPEACLPTASDSPAVGAGVFAIGSPGGKELSFSMSRGIVSGNRELDGAELIQTDTAISPGNSGGPLVDEDGNVVGIVSRKVVGAAVEGIAFGVPIDAGLDAIDTTWGDTSSVDVPERNSNKEKTSSSTVVDYEDKKLSVDPEGDRDQRIRDATPAYVPVMRWGGLGLMGFGAAAVGYSALFYSEFETTRSEFNTLRLINDVGYISAGVGLVSFVTHFFLIPDDPGVKVEDNATNQAPAPKTSIALGPTSLHLNVQF